MGIRFIGSIGIAAALLLTFAVHQDAGAASVTSAPATVGQLTSYENSLARINMGLFRQILTSNLWRTGAAGCGQTCQRAPALQKAASATKDDANAIGHALSDAKSCGPISTAGDIQKLIKEMNSAAQQAQKNQQQSQNDARKAATALAKRMDSGRQVAQGPASRFGGASDADTKNHGYDISWSPIANDATQSARMLDPGNQLYCALRGVAAGWYVVTSKTGSTMCYKTDSGPGSKRLSSDLSDAVGNAINAGNNNNPVTVTAATRAPTLDEQEQMIRAGGGTTRAEEILAADGIKLATEANKAAKDVMQAASQSGKEGCRAPALAIAKIAAKTSLDGHELSAMNQKIMSGAKKCSASTVAGKVGELKNSKKIGSAGDFGSDIITDPTGKVLKQNDGTVKGSLHLACYAQAYGNGIADQKGFGVKDAQDAAQKLKANVRSLGFLERRPSLIHRFEIAVSHAGDWLAGWALPANAIAEAPTGDPCEKKEDFGARLTCALQGDEVLADIMNAVEGGASQFLANTEELLQVSRESILSDALIPKDEIASWMFPDEPELQSQALADMISIEQEVTGVSNPDAARNLARKGPATLPKQEGGVTSATLSKGQAQVDVSYTGTSYLYFGRAGTPSGISVPIPVAGAKKVYFEKKPAVREAAQRAPAAAVEEHEEAIPKDAIY